jgi:SAM-dependent methyltransferase
MALHPSPRPRGLWAASDRYEPYIGRWSRKVAQEFIAWLSVPAGKDWLDVGCGTGALTRAIVQQAAPHWVTGIDFSAAFLAQAQRELAGSRVNLQQGEAQALPVQTAVYDAAVSGLVLNFVPDPQQAVAEMARAVRPAGLAAAYVWDYAGRMEFLRYFWDAAIELDPDAARLDEGRFALCQPGALVEVFGAAGLSAIETRSIEVATVFRDFDDFWTPFLDGPGPAPRYVMALPDAKLDLLRETLRAKLPVAPDDSISLLARAWAVRGRQVDPTDG